MAPPNPATPVTEPTADLGKISDASVNILQDQAWCAATARLKIPIAVHRLWILPINMIGMMATAYSSMDNRRAALILSPSLTPCAGSQPPPMLPTAAAL